MAVAMSWTQVWINIAMAVVGGLGGFALGYWVRGLATNEVKPDGTTTGVFRVRKRRFGFNQILSALIVMIVLVLMITGAVTQAEYDRKLQCNSNYIQQFQETLRQNTARTQAANQAELDLITAQRNFLTDADGTNPAGLRQYVEALTTYQQSLQRARDERQPYPTNPNCEES